MKHCRVVCAVLAFATLAGCRRTVPEHDVLFLQAVQDGNLPRIQALLDSGANVNAGWEEGEALRKAVMHEDVELIRLLLSRGAKVNVASWRGWTPLFDAVVRQDNQEIAELLLSHGADANHKDDAGHLLLHHSLGPSGRPGMAELLIAGGADIHALDREGRTAIRIAVEQGRREALEMLLKKGARADERGPRGQTLLHYAALRGHGSIATLLMAQGLDVNAKDDSGRTPLHGAAEENSLWAAEVLLNAGADPNAASDSGMTPLHIAAGGGHCAMAELLIERGADRTAKTRRGYTPADLARDAGHQDVVSLLAGAPPRKSVSQVLAEGESSEVVPVKRLVRDNSALAFDLYRRLCVEKGNLFFSPYSVSTALALVYAGARENTAREIAAAMHFSSGPEGLHPAFSELQAGMNEVQKAGNIKLYVANSLWPQKGFELLPDYLALVRTRYDSCITPVDFDQDKVGACATINQWVEEKTERRIEDLLQPGMLADPTFLVLVNAIYFKGAWENEFDPNHTRDEAFHVSPQRSVQTPFMRQCVRFGYAKLDSLKIVELPYRGGEFSMLVLLPDRIDGLASLEQSLSVNVLATWRSRLKEETVELVLPKFRITYTAQLRQSLEGLGMKDAFLAGKADFAGVDGRSDRLFLGGVIHKAFVDVNEEGTEAAAATATGMMAGMPPKPPEFRADHPFLFLIQDNRTGSILFLGRVVDPTQTGE